MIPQCPHYNNSNVQQALEIPQNIAISNRQLTTAVIELLVYKLHPPNVEAPKSPVENLFTPSPVSPATDHNDVTDAKEPVNQFSRTPVPTPLNASACLIPHLSTDRGNLVFKQTISPRTSSVKGFALEPQRFTHSSPPASEGECNDLPWPTKKDHMDVHRSPPPQNTSDPLCLLSGVPLCNKNHPSELQRTPADRWESHLPPPSCNTVLEPSKDAKMSPSADTRSAKPLHQTADPPCLSPGMSKENQLSMLQSRPINN